MYNNFFFIFSQRSGAIFFKSSNITITVESVCSIFFLWSPFYNKLLFSAGFAVHNLFPLVILQIECIRLTVLG